jgi:hypothetical protein
MPDSSYWNDLIPGATDISFCDDVDSYPVESLSFEERFRTLLRELVPLLRRMRNHCTPVLVYPRHPSAELSEAHSALTRELNARSYRVLPEDELDPRPHVRLCDLAVLLFGASYDETTRLLIDDLKEAEKPFVVWPSPALEKSGAAEQRGFFRYLIQLETFRKTLLSPAITPGKLGEEVFALLSIGAKMPPATEGKPRVYLIYDARQNSEKDNAGQIVFHFRNEFHFDYSDNPRQHNLCLTRSDGVLLLWGDAGEEWCATEFEQMVRLSSQPKARGLCLFNPKESKIALAEKIRSSYIEPPIHVAEQFGHFEPARLEPFFNRIRRSQAGPA